MNPGNAADESTLALSIGTALDALGWDKWVYYISCAFAILIFLAAFLYRIPEQHKTDSTEYAALGVGAVAV